MERFLVGKYMEVSIFVRLSKTALRPFSILYLSDSHLSIKGILHQKIFYRLNLIFWIVMGCGKAGFGQRGLKTTET